MTARWVGSAAVLCCAAACTTLTPKPMAVQVSSRPLPVVQNIVVVVLENKNVDDARRQPFLARLADTGAELTNYWGVAHPSQPNYVAMVSGSTNGVRGDRSATLDRPHLGDRLDSWMSYAEGYPTGCPGE